MKKVIGQTVRDIKREVNKKVLKVPGIEQKILDATSNEPWGPHGTHLAEIAQATRNYPEYTLIMAVIWKRINDTGKNWRHVHKALTVLEYLVAHGSERVIDDIKEHTRLINTLSNFQYIDSNGRDQGSNVRKKSQSLVALVNDKERIQEVRQKALANRDKSRSSFSIGGTNRSSTGGFGDNYDDQPEGRYGYREDDRESYEKGKDNGCKDDDKYDRAGDRYSRDGDRKCKDDEELYGRDGRRTDDDRDYHPGSRSVDRYTDQSFDDDDRYSSKGGGRVDDHSQDDRLGHQLPGQNGAAPPSYEEAVTGAHTHIQNKWDEATITSPPHKSSSPPVPKATSPSKSSTEGFDHVVPAVLPSSPGKEVYVFDEFDPRGSISAEVPIANSPELDFFGSIPASDSTNSLSHSAAIHTTAISSGDMPTNSGFGTSFLDPSTTPTPYENPFGDPPFKAIPQESFQDQPPNQPFGSTGSVEPFPSIDSATETIPSFDFGDPLAGLTFSPVANDPHSSPNPEFSSSELPATLTSGDVLLDDLFGPVHAQTAQPAAPTRAQMDFLPQPGPSVVFPPQEAPVSFMEAQPAAFYEMGSGHMNLQQQGLIPSASLPSLPALISSHAVQPAFPNNTQTTYLNPQRGMISSSVSWPSLADAVYSQPAAQPGLQSTHPNLHLLQQPGIPAASSPLQAVPTYPQASQPNLQPAHLNHLLQEPPITSAGLLVKSQLSKDKFETRSTVWADTLNRGLVNLDISGSKTNPLADIGIDFDAINRREKRTEAKNSAPAPVASTTTMGKAMGSGSGMGRSGPSGRPPPPNPMVIGSGGMGMMIGAGMGMGMSGYGSGNMNQPSMGMMGMGMNMGMGPMMQHQAAMPPPGAGYNHMMGMGNYTAPQQQQTPYGGSGAPQQQTPYGGSGAPQQQPYGGGGGSGGYIR